MMLNGRIIYKCLMDTSIVENSKEVRRKVHDASTNQGPSSVTALK